jgi:hypothetical protein
MANNIDEILIQKIKWILSGKDNYVRDDSYLATAEIKRLIDVHDQLKRVQNMREMKVIIDND